jgi:F-type H+-transporting ATPase subunit alpha
VAFNDDLFEATDPDAIPTLLAELEGRVRHSALNLDTPREEWSAAVASWLPTQPGMHQHDTSA